MAGEGPRADQTCVEIAGEPPLGLEGLEILDVSNPASPVEVGNYNTEGYAMGVAVAR